MKKWLFPLMCAGTILFSCSGWETQETLQNPTDDGPVLSNEWSIPVEDIIDGGPGRDGIPALESPVLTTAANASILSDTDLVLGYKNGNDIRAYQHIILDWHEIVNDRVGDVSVAITYCPLTGTGIGWNRMINGKETTFGVSGLLHNTNLIPFDRETTSNWSQILNESVNGELLGQKAGLIQLVETNWKTWKNMYPDSKILSLNTGFSRVYGVYPYVDYRTNHSFFLFPVMTDKRLPAKERVLTIVDGNKARVYRFEDLMIQNIIRDSFEGKNYVIVGNAHFMMSFALNSDQQSLQFNYAFDGSEVVLGDNEGNTWNIFGEAVSGPRSGEVLTSGNAFMAYWFSVPAFYTTEIYNS